MTDKSRDGADYWAMLSARSPRFAMEPAGYGALSQEDIRLALQGLERGPMLMGMVFDAGDWDSLPDLERWLWQAIMKRAVEGRWQYHKYRDGKDRPIDRRLARLILIELVSGRECIACGGIGAIVIAAQPVQCDTCQGTRRVKLRGSDKAAHLDMSRENYSRFWSTRYEACYSMANQWLGRARSHLRSRVTEFFKVA